MVLNRKNGYRRLALAVEKRLKSGLVISGDTLQFMVSTYAIESPPELEVLLRNPEDSDALPLLALLFTPEESFQAELEEHIEKHIPADRDEQNIIDQLDAGKISVPLLFPDKQGALFFLPPRHLIEAFVQALNIRKQLPPELRKAIRKHVPAPTARDLKVKLRNTRIDLSRPICTFLERFFEKADTSGEHFLPDAVFCLSVLDVDPGTSSLFDLFMQKKRRLLTALQQAARFEKQLAGSNIETLMLQGVRAPHIDKTAAKQQITRIDAVCLMVFGITDPLLQVPATANLGNFSNRDDLQKAFEILS